MAAPITNAWEEGHDGLSARGSVSVSVEGADMRGGVAVMMALWWVTAARAGEDTPSEGEPPAEVSTPTRGQQRMYVGLAVPLVVGGLTLEGEREVDEQSSVSLGLRVSFNAAEWTSLSVDRDRDYVLVAAEPGLRLYPRGRTLEGMWLGPRLEVGHAWLRSSSEGPAAREWELGGAMLAGYSLRLARGFTVQAALGLGLTYRLGLGLTSPREGEEYQVRGDPYGRWVAGPRGHLSVGWSF
jgi:hypothetical protein